MTNSEGKEQGIALEHSADSGDSKRASRAAWADCQMGDIFTFGNYPQSANGAVAPIEWQVLRRDSDGLLVIAKYALDCKKYDEVWRDTTWSECTLRRWLNNEFIHKAFNVVECQWIKAVHLQNSNSHWKNVPGGPDTDDKVFLLSYGEAVRLFADDNSRKCKPTKYAMANHAWASEEGMCWWWLRSPGSNTRSAACVDFDGGIYSYVDFVCYAVRPAMKIAL